MAKIDIPYNLKLMFSYPLDPLSYSYCEVCRLYAGLLNIMVYFIVWTDELLPGTGESGYHIIDACS